MNTVVAIVVTYNRLNLLKECIEKLISQTFSCDILIVDNNSTDFTKDYILKTYKNHPAILYKNTGANLGGAGGFHYGIYLAVKLGYEFVWVMDDDCMPMKNTLQVFMEYEKMHYRDYGFLSSKVLWRDNSLCMMNIQRSTMYRKVKDFSNPIVSISMASFVSLFIPVYIIREVGLPIKEFFIWTDDWEFTRRISLRYKCFLLNQSIVIHKCAVNMGGDVAIDSVERLSRYHYLYRNDFYLYRREGLKGYLYEFVRLIYHIFKVFFVASDHKWQRMKCIIAGTVKGMFFYPKIEKIERF